MVEIDVTPILRRLLHVPKVTDVPTTDGAWWN